MIVKAVTLFLIAMIVLGMFGKLRLPKLPQQKQKLKSATKCKACGGYVLGDAPCPCKDRT